jgi:hypothetical protein
MSMSNGADENEDLAAEDGGGQYYQPRIEVRGKIIDSWVRVSYVESILFNRNLPLEQCLAGPPSPADVWGIALE